MLRGSHTDFGSESCVHARCSLYLFVHPAVQSLEVGTAPL